MERGRDMRVTLSKFIPAKRKFEDMSPDGLRSRVLSLMGGFLEEEIKVISLKGGGR
jgi:hypothetical protein